MKSLRRKSTPIILVAGFFMLLGFQNCSQVKFEGTADPTSTAVESTDVPVVISTPTPPEVCNGVSCSLDPLTTKAAVTTILMALGDQANNELVVNGASSQLLAETLVRNSSPVKEPKILFAWDSNADNESREDRKYVLETLLARYNVTAMNVPAGGLKPADLEGFDLVWFTNPGYPMNSVVTRDTLMQFAGGVILEGDDLAHGANFDLQPLTGLKFLDNGTSIACGDKSYGIDNNAGSQYSVQLDQQYFAGADASVLSIHYGNDLDNSKATDSVQVLAWAKGSPEACTDLRPAIVRYEKAPAVPTEAKAKARAK